MSTITPESNKIRSAVHTNGGISKALLTPCRRIGLSKNRKIHNSFTSPFGTRNCELQVTSCIDSEVHEYVHKSDAVSFSNSTIQSNSAILNVQTQADIHITEPQKEDVNNYNKVLKEVKIKRCLNTNFKENVCKLRSNQNIKNNITNRQIDNIIHSNKHNNTERKISESYNINDFVNNTELKRNVHLQNDCIRENTQISLHPIKTHSETSTKVSTDKVNLSPSSNAPGSYTSSNKDFLNIKKSNNLDQFNNSTQTKCNSDQNRGTTKPIKRKLSMKKTVSCCTLIESDEEVFTNISANSSDSAEKENFNIIEKIIQLQKAIQNKEMDLQKLQQVQIYRSLHKLEDINIETNIWKISCQEALRDLLIKLKEHATIDMSILLQNLKAPSHLVKYNAENDNFV